MESLIILIIIAVVSNLITGKKKKEQMSKELSDKSERIPQAWQEPWAGIDITEDYDDFADDFAMGEQPVQNPTYSTPAEMYGANKKLTEPVIKSTNVSTYEVDNNKNIFQSFDNEKKKAYQQISKPQAQQPAYDLCEAHPEVTPVADMQGSSIIEKELVSTDKLPLQKKVAKVANNNKQQATVAIQPIIKPTLSKLQQGVVMAEILGAPVARRQRY